MTGIYILIVVLLGQTTTSTVALTSVTAEFSSREACEFALKQHQTSITSPSNLRIVSQGCYKKSM